MAPNGEFPTGKEDVDTEDDEEYVFARGPLGGDTPLDWLEPETLSKYQSCRIFGSSNLACLETEAGKVEARPAEILGVKLDLWRS